MNEGIENPEAVGNPDEEPVVHVSDGLARILERSRCAECGLVNWQHSEYCTMTLAQDFRELVIKPLADEVARQLDALQDGVDVDRAKWDNP